MSTIWISGRPIKGEKIRNRKYVPKNYGEPCSFNGCKIQPTQKYETTIQDETKLLPLCSTHKDLI